MTSALSAIGEALRRALLLLLSKKSFERVLDGLMRARPDESLEVLYSALKREQRVAFDRKLTQGQLAEVISSINEIPGGSFKYVPNGEIKLVLGSGGIQEMEGWLSTDIDQLNIVEESSWHRLLMWAVLIGSLQSMSSNT